MKKAKKEQKKLRARLRAIDRAIEKKEQKKARKYARLFSPLWYAERLWRVGTGEYQFCPKATREDEWTNAPTR